MNLTAQTGTRFLSSDLIEAAFAARSLAGFIFQSCVFMKEHIEQVPEAFKIFESGTDEGAEDLKAYLRS